MLNVQSLNLAKSTQLNEKLHHLIPGGAHTYAKGDDQFPENLNPVLSHGKGCHVWDVDGNEYIEYGMGLRSVTLGHAYDRVNEAAYKQMQLGSNFGRPAAIEAECAEYFLDLVEGMDMVKFAKNGSDATSAAVKLARAYTGRDVVAICSDHPFFSIDDWFIGATKINAGIPKAIKDLTVAFRFNNIESVEQMFAQHPGKIACVILEAEKYSPPQDGFLHKLKEVCHANGAIMIIDEIITGFRYHLGGAQAIHGVVPDLTTFGKAMGNGYSIAALAGKRELMELGGLHHDKERVFLLSTTFGAEYPSLAAALETMKIYKEEDVIATLNQQGQRLADGITQSVTEHDLDDYFGVMGRPSCLVYYTRDLEGNPSQPFRTLFLQEMVKNGLIMPSLIVSYSHTDADIDRTVETIHEALFTYKKALNEGVDKYLVGRPVQPVYRKQN